MKIETLSAIIRLEKEIREQLALEQRRAEERLEEVLQDGKEELAREEARLQQKMAAAVTTARLGDARKRADTIVAEAVARADRLACLDNESLKQLVLGELSRVVPGRKR